MRRYKLVEPQAGPLPFPFAPGAVVDVPSPLARAILRGIDFLQGCITAIAVGLVLFYVVGTCVLSHHPETQGRRPAVTKHAPQLVVPQHGSTLT